MHVLRAALADKCGVRQKPPGYIRQSGENVYANGNSFASMTLNNGMCLGSPADSSEGNFSGGGGQSLPCIVIRLMPA